MSYLMSYDDIELICRNARSSQVLDRYPDFDPEGIADKSLIDNPYVHYACYHNHLHVVKVLVQCGASLSRRNKAGDTPLNIVCGYMHYGPLVEWLLTKLDVISSINNANSYGSTPLHTATYWNNIEIIHLLLDHGADPTITNPYGQRPSAIAFKHDMKNTTLLLLNFEHIFELKQTWRPWNHYMFPISYQHAMCTLVILAKSIKK